MSKMKRKIITTSETLQQFKELLHPDSIKETTADGKKATISTTALTDKKEIGKQYVQIGDEKGIKCY